MSAALSIRAETPGDHHAIYDLTRRAFAPMAYSDGNEQDIINTLRATGGLAISLVAEMHGAIVGHIAFSPAMASADDGDWFALGPVAVEPALQRRGIGSALIGESIARLKARGAAGCILVGDPAYYSRFGFVPAPACAPAGYPAEYFMVLPLAGRVPQSAIGFHPAFDGHDF